MIKRLSAAFLLTIALWLIGCETKQVPTQENQPTEVVRENSDNRDAATGANERSNKGGQGLIYTKHARCRMQCRHIDEQEIQEIIAADHINHRKSNPNDNRCPTYAYEGYSHDRQHLRIVIAKCETVWKVVTCIDLENEFACNCK